MNRRKFLKNTMLGSAGLFTLENPFLSCITPSKQNKLGVALVGLGYYSTDLLAPALQLTKHCYLAGIVTGSAEKAKSWQQQFKIPDKNIYNYQNFESIINNDEIDVVYIVLPPSMHAEYSIKAANAGKQVWCEKPMALNVNECSRMIKACNDNKVKLSIGYRMQHEPNTQTLIGYAKTKPFGNIKKINLAAGYYDSRINHWKQKKSMGGGATYDMGVYCINASRYVTGLEPIAVTAVKSTNRPDIYTEVDETMNFKLGFADGIIADCETSFGKGLNSLYTGCENGWYKLEPFQAYSGINGITSNGDKLNARITNQQAKQMDDDALAIINNQPVLVPGEEGLKDIKVVEAIYKSAETGERVEI
jgi:glucose-fructose oxidoreductase